MQVRDHSSGIRPGAVCRKSKVGEPVRRSVWMQGVLGIPEGNKRRLIAPGLDHDHADRNIFLLAAGHFGHHPCLGVPLIAAHPRPENPAGWQLRVAGVVQELAEHLNW